MTSWQRGAFGALTACAWVLAAGRVYADDTKTVNLKEGDPAPQFQSTDDQGKPWKSADHFGKKVVVVYFYPADLTRGCTLQACAFRDDMKKLADKGVEIIGISGDSVRNHQLFKKVHNLNFTLLADEKGEVAKKFGVPLKPGGTIKTKDPEGNAVELTRGVTASRWTFVIGKDGKIAYKETDVKQPAENSKTVLAVVEKLNK